MVGDCGTNMAMAARHPRKPRPPLTAAKLDELALHYVGRFATSRSKLTTYLKRKLRERGWEGQAEPDLDGLAAKLARLGYVDDRAYAVSKARSLTSRGYGERRVGQALALAGIDEDDGSEARSLAQSEAVESALRKAPLDRPLRQVAARSERARASPFCDGPRWPPLRPRQGNRGHGTGR